MHFLQRVLFDARRPLTAASPRSIQRAEADSPAPPLEEQEDGAMTVYRFQKEGAPRSREVSGGDKSAGDIPRRTSAFPLVGVGTRVPADLPESSADQVSAGDPVFSVKAVQKRSGLATGETLTANTPYATDVPERVLSEEFGSARASSDHVTSVDSVHDRTDPSVDGREVEGFQHDEVSESLRQVPGTDTPSESYPSEPFGRSVTAAAETGFTGVESRLPSADASEEAPASAREAFQRASRDFRTHSRSFEWADLGGDPHPPAAPAPAASPRQDAQPAPPLATEPRVSIGQVDVVVVQTPPPLDRASRKSGRQFLSRNYLRRL